MHSAVIDTLSFANRLKEAGFEPAHAEGMALVLNEELAQQVVTRAILHDELRPICNRLDRLETSHIALGAKVDALEHRLDTRIDGVEAKFDSKFDALNDKIDATHRELDAKVTALDGKLNILTGAMALGFTVLVALGLYNALPRGDSAADRAAVSKQEEAIRTNAATP